MYRILIVEDDKGIRTSIAQQLLLWQYDSFIVSDFTNVIQAFNEYRPDLVLMDIGLPFYDGYFWCGEIRKLSKVPVIFISSASDNMNIIMAINMGADDFICKPFSMEVLLAKIKALLRRTNDYQQDSELIEYKGMTINTNNNSVFYQNQELELSKNEFRILLTLIQSKGKVVTREKLMKVLWKTDVYVDENTLSVNVNRLRRKLESIGIVDLIETKSGLGYIVG